jgi:hypothetical protein
VAEVSRWTRKVAFRRVANFSTPGASPTHTQPPLDSNLSVNAHRTSPLRLSITSTTAQKTHRGKNSSWRSVNSLLRCSTSCSKVRSRPHDPPEYAANSRRTAAFEAFLTTFKTSPEQIATALGNISIDDDDLSDDYDFMDEDDDAQERRRQEKARSRLPQHKYKDMLQELADRKIDEVMIELDDLESVCSCHSTR